MTADIMVGRPVKFRILEILSDGSELWCCDIVNQLMEEYGIKSAFGRDTLNFDLVEVAASGFIVDVEQEIDESGKLRVGALLTKYKITDLGKSQYEELVSKVGISR